MKFCSKEIASHCTPAETTALHQSAQFNSQKRVNFSIQLKYLNVMIGAWYCLSLVTNLFPLQDERVLSFIPPDGSFRLLSYHISSTSTVAIPVYVRHNISFKEASGGRLDITVGPKQTMGRTVSGCNVITN